MVASNIAAVWLNLLDNDILRKGSQIASHVTLMAVTPKPLFCALKKTSTLVLQEPFRSLPEISSYYFFYILLLYLVNLVIRLPDCQTVKATILDGSPQGNLSLTVRLLFLVSLSFNILYFMPNSRIGCQPGYNVLRSPRAAPNSIIS